MISCYIIGDLSTIDNLKQQIKDFTLTILFGYSIDPSRDINLILNSKPQIVFVDTSFIDKYRHLLFRIANVCTLVYVSECSNHAYDAYETFGFDYLLKPLSYERLEISINKFIQFSLSAGNVQQEYTPQQEITESFFIKIDKKSKKELLIICSEVLYIEAHQNYVFIHMINKERYTCHNTMKEMEKNLPLSYFIRTHKSYIINYNRVTGIEGNRVIVDNDPKIIIYIGNTYKKMFFERKNKKIIKKQNQQLLPQDLYSSTACILFFLASLCANCYDIIEQNLQTMMGLV